MYFSLILEGSKMLLRQQCLTSPTQHKHLKHKYTHNARFDDLISFCKAAPADY